MSNAVPKILTTHHNSLSYHARVRSLERLGKQLNPAKANHIVNDILSGRSVFLHSGTTPGTVIFAVLIDGKAVPVVYHKKSKTIVTVMHRSSILNLLNKQLRTLQEKQNA